VNTISERAIRTAIDFHGNRQQTEKTVGAGGP